MKHLEPFPLMETAGEYQTPTIGDIKAGRRLIDTVAEYLNALELPEGPQDWVRNEIAGILQDEEDIIAHDHGWGELQEDDPESHKDADYIRIDPEADIISNVVENRGDEIHDGAYSDDDCETPLEDKDYNEFNDKYMWYDSEVGYIWSIENKGLFMLEMQKRCPNIHSVFNADLDMWMEEIYPEIKKLPNAMRILSDLKSDSLDLWEILVNIAKEAGDNSLETGTDLGGYGF